jgi:hypothetical protein
MLYNEPTIGWNESKKERNFYNKVFCGCLFNELIEGYERRCSYFLDKLVEKYKYTCEEFSISQSEEFLMILEKLRKDLEKGEVHIDFDHHVNNELSENDRGELADILISSPLNFIAIEAKFQEDWKYDKDIIENLERILKHKEKNSIQILLITDKKWDNSKKKAPQKGSHYTKLLKHLQDDKSRPPFLILLWEDIYSILKKEGLESVCKYMERTLGINQVFSIQY